MDHAVQSLLTPCATTATATIAVFPIISAILLPTEEQMAVLPAATD